MENREKVAGLSLTSTIMQGINLFFSLGMMILFVILLFVLLGVIGESAGLMENVNPDDVTAGWQVLFGAGGAFFGVIILVIVVLALIMFAGPIVAGIFAFIYGIRTYKKRYTSDFVRMVKNDSIFKLVINAVAVTGSLFTIPASGSEISFLGQLGVLILMLVISIPSIVTVIVSIMALCNIKYIDDDLTIYDGR